ncbi:MAG: hypothetical protein ASARMPRED_008794 [Alectoria sarmentosa]|nr:MAG: hypothetical protein ASARMPRED_008794 [Alectoria sarmentosa]
MFIIHMELLGYGVDRPLRFVPGRNINDNCRDLSDACMYITGNLRVNELSCNINFTIHVDFQGFRWVKTLAQIRGERAIFHHNSPNKHGLKSTEALVVLANQMSRDDWGTDDYRWEALFEYLSSEVLL